MASSDRKSKQVNSLLHTLRGEDFRRLQNKRRSRSHLTTRLQPPSVSFLPFLEHLPDSSDSDAPPGTSPVLQSVPTLPRPSNNKRTSGPPPPPSWLNSKSSERKLLADPQWRYEVLRPFFRPSSNNGECDSENSLGFLDDVATFRDMCIDVIIEEGIDEELVPYIPSHLRRDILRRAAVVKPILSTEEVLLLCSKRGTGGELVLTGPEISPSVLQALLADYTPSSDPTKEEDWDDMEEQHEDIPELTKFALFNTSLPASCVTFLPPTLTHLALLHLPSSILSQTQANSIIPNAPTPIWRLPPQLPLIEFIDISFNPWILPTRSFDRIPWGAWRRVKFVGLRGCGFDSQELRDGVRVKIVSSVKRSGICIVSFAD